MSRAQWQMKGESIPCRVCMIICTSRGRYERHMRSKMHGNNVEKGRIADEKKRATEAEERILLGLEP